MKNLSNIIDELDLVTKKYVDDAAEAKVDKVEGKQLSTNDYTTEEKEKLNSLENYTLPMASADALGGVKIGNNLAIDENGTLSANIQSVITYINDPVIFVDGTKPSFTDGWYVFTNTVTMNGVDVVSSTGGGWFSPSTLMYIQNSTSNYVYIYFLRPDKGRSSSALATYMYYNGTKWMPTTHTQAYSASALTTSSGLSKTNTTSYTPTGDYHPATKKYVDDAIAAIEIPETSEIVIDTALSLESENPVQNKIVTADLKTVDQYNFLKNERTAAFVAGSGSTGAYTMKNVNSSVIVNGAYYYLQNKKVLPCWSCPSLAVFVSEITAQLLKQ